MCGIVGYFDYGGRGVVPRTDTFDQMVDSLTHRGPDGRGTWFDVGLGLGHRRLSVLDPTAAGTQPMCSADASLVVTFNGEIYNFRELRSELIALGHHFRTNCDTEVLLTAYAEWSLAAVQRLNGIFAFALWDRARRRLWLARDRLGIKPLFFSLAGGVLRFGSEARAVLADPAFQRRPSPAGVNAFLTFGFVPAPLSGFAGLEQLPPAHEMIVENNSVTQRPYWALTMAELPMRRDEADAGFAGKFRQAVTRQLVSDVPVGAFLSGGLDSAAVVFEMAQDAPRPVQTFSVGFEASSFDERAAAAETAHRLGVEHHEVCASFDVQSAFDQYVAHCDEPFADSSSLAVNELCRVASQGVTVALSGDGADELLGGYSTYTATALAAVYRRLPRWGRVLARSAAAALPVSDRRYGWHQFANRFVLGAEEGEGRDFCAWRIHFRDVNKHILCRPGYFAGCEDPLEQYAGLYRRAPNAGDQLKRMLYADLSFYLPNDMLVKVDRMSMAHGLEVRVPFLDHEFVEFCAGLRSHWLARPPWYRRGKRILRRYLKKRLGTALARRRKTGFNIPVEHAMRGPLLGRLRDAVTAQKFREAGPFNVPRLLEFAEGHVRREYDAGHALFSALVLACWWERWL